MGDELKGQSGYFEPLEVLKEALYLITINSKWDSVADLLSITQSDDIVTVNPPGQQISTLFYSL